VTAARQHEVTTVEREALTEMTRLFRDALGDHAALAAARRQIAHEIDALVAVLQTAGVDTEALLDEIDAELEAQR
jgi:cbb3-type cytochrome oxidase cytochrome c subunit